MPISSTHPEYKRWSARWLRCRHFVEGEDAVKAQGTTYLSPLDFREVQTTEGIARYKAYKDNAAFYGATGRTVEGLVGAAHRKEPTFKVPDQIKSRLDDITGTGISATELTKLMIAELLTTGRLGVLVDKAEGVDPKPAVVSLYRAECITNWLERGTKAVVLKESKLVAEKASDPYDLKEVQIYRELALGPDGAYHHRVHIPKAGTSVAGGEQFDVTDIIPTFRARAVAEIPFVFISPRGLTDAIEAPPILGLVNVNLAHYRLSADHSHGLHWTALPTPVFTGVDDDSTELAIGPQGGIILPQGGTATMLEFTGQGLGSIERARETLETQMGALGAQLLTPPKGVEAADTAKIHQSGNVVTLHTIVQAVEEGLEKVLSLIAAWEGISGDVVEVELNKEFIEAVANPELLSALFQAWQGGGIDLDTFLWNVKKYGLANPDDTIDMIKARLDAEAAKAQEAADRAFKNQQAAVIGAAGSVDQGAEETDQ